MAPGGERQLPAGVHAEVVKGSDWVEALFFLEPHRALIAGDLLIGKAGGGIELPVGWFPKGEQDWAEQELKPELRKRLAELPVELVARLARRAGARAAPKRYAPPCLNMSTYAPARVSREAPCPLSGVKRGAVPREMYRFSRGSTLMRSPGFTKSGT